MNITREYLDHHISWYQSKKKTQRILFKTSSALVIAMGAAIPFFGGVEGSSARTMVGVLGIAVATVGGLQLSFRWQDNWRNFTAAQSRLESVDRQYRLALACPGVEEGQVDREYLAVAEQIVSGETQSFFCDVGLAFQQHDDESRGRDPAD